MNWHETKKRLLAKVGLQQERWTKKEPDLWAFWKHGVYPYFLSGRVVEQDERGRVKVDGYSSWFNPFYIVLGARGEDIHKLGKRLRSAYKIHEECARNAAGTVGERLLREAGLPVAGLHLSRTGWQGEAYRNLFEKQLKLEKK
jgi:hypothetical protein